MKITYYVPSLITTTFTKASFNFEMNSTYWQCHCLHDQAVSCLIHFYCGVGLSVCQAMRWWLDIRLCKIHLIVQFLFFEASWKNFGFFPILGFFQIYLGRRKLRRPRRIPPWAPQLTAPKKNSTLGAATYGAQGKFEKKLENWEKSKVLSLCLKK